MIVRPNGTHEPNSEVPPPPEEPSFGYLGKRFDSESFTSWHATAHKIPLFGDTVSFDLVSYAVWRPTNLINLLTFLYKIVICKFISFIQDIISQGTHMVGNLLVIID